MRHIFLSIILAFTLAMMSAGRTNMSQRERPPIVMRLESQPQYGRKRPLRRFFTPQLN
ncbi:MAG TPA: hypothetical protein VEC36_02110 [Patescibacteria group bacterium]|nr:hypothetical protein [Patescibacteria group bacterium]